MDIRGSIESFSTAWPSDRRDYRTDGDESWKDYAVALRFLATSGGNTPDEVIKGLHHPNRQTRAISARALGFINTTEAVSGLSKVLLSDEWETSRLIASDALGMIHTERAMDTLRRARESETHKDVLLHIKNSLSRNSGLEQEAVADLLAITQLGAAQTGKPAPNFTLSQPWGRKISLSEYRNNQNVVLIFIYGDG